jgi:serine phosphatase RsbU (regulator of sigma subunit)
VPTGHSLSRRFSAVFIGVVACIFLGCATMAIVVNLARIEATLQARLDHTMQLAQISLSTPLWNIDNKAVEKFLEALLLDPALAYADVVWGEKVLARHTRPAWQHTEFGFFTRSQQFLPQTAEIQYEGQPVGIIRLAVSRDSIRHELWLNILGILALTGLLILAIFLTSIGITRRYIARPLATLQRSATLIAHGDLDAAIVIDRRDEIGRLGEDLQVMREALKGSVGALRESNAQLAEYSRTLEQRVRERTAQLAQANAAITALNARLQADNVRLSADLDLLRQMQLLILPKPDELHAIADLDIAGFMEPAAEVGGDYYDVLHTDGVTTIGIGDVTGHGLESCILMVMTQTAVRTLQEGHEQDPVRFLTTLNRTLYKNVQRMQSEKNLTLVLLTYAAGTVSISGQHEQALIVRRGGQVERINTLALGFPIALDADIADCIGRTRVQLAPGDGVVLYTDGITEARDMRKEQYGLERLCGVVSAHWHQSAEEVKEAVIEAVRQHIGAQKIFDDMSLLVLKQKAPRPDVLLPHH